MADVVVVDDDEDVAWLVEQFLEADGHDVRVAHDGEAGLAMLRQRRPDVAIVDIEMPRLTGPDMAYRMFVHNAGLENVPLVLISGVADLAAVAERVGTPYFAPKPFDPAELSSLVRRALSERALPSPIP